MIEEINSESLTNEELDEIAEQIKDGFTSGRLDREDGRMTYWNLQINAWKDE